MQFNVPPIGGVDRSAGTPPTPRRGREAASGDFSKALAGAGVSVDAVPASPPAALHDEIERAAARYDELSRQKRELHFTSEPNSGRVVIQVRDLDGNVLRTVPPSKALDVIAGAPLED
jgi:flagellar protein FlaG